MWEPLTPQRRYGEFTRGFYKGRKRNLRAKAQGTPTVEGHTEKEEPMKESKDRYR